MSAGADRRTVREDLFRKIDDILHCEPAHYIYNAVDDILESYDVTPKKPVADARWEELVSQWPQVGTCPRCGT